MNIAKDTEAYATMSSAIQEAQNYVRWIVDSFRPYFGQRLLEIGTGYGNYRAAIETAAQANPSGRYIHADIADPSSVELIGESFDSILCCNVLEHIEAAPVALDNMRSLLVPGGHLLLFVPALPALYGDMDRPAGHLRRYTCRQAHQDILAAGLTPVRVEYFNPIGGLGWWLNKFRRLEHLDDPTTNRQILLFDRYVLPLSRTLNPLTRPPWSRGHVIPNPGE